MGRSLGSLAIKKYLGHRMGNIPPEDFDAMYNYYYHICMIGPGSEYALQTLFKLGIWAKFPIEEKLDGISIPISFFYGENDWMDARGGL